jgi:hypothetical protein
VRLVYGPLQFPKSVRHGRRAGRREHTIRESTHDPPVYTRPASLHAPSGTPQRSRPRWPSPPCHEGRWEGQSASPQPVRRCAFALACSRRHRHHASSCPNRVHQLHFKRWACKPRAHSRINALPGAILWRSLVLGLIAGGHGNRRVSLKHVLSRLNWSTPSGWPVSLATTRETTLCEQQFCGASGTKQGEGGHGNRRVMQSPSNRRTSNSSRSSIRAAACVRTDQR